MNRNKHRSDPPRTLSATEFAEAICSGGWCITGGPGFKVVEPLLVGHAILGRNVAVMEVDSGARYPLSFEIDHSVITSPEPHIMHVNRIFPQKQQGKGGVEREVSQLGVWLKFVNLGVKNSEGEKRRRKEEASRQVAAAAHKLFLDDLGVVGKVLENITFVDGGTRAIISFDDGTELEVLGNNISFQRLIRGDAVSRAYAEEAEFDS